MEIVEQCHICLEPFSAEHPPARFRGANRCQHILSAPCLRKRCHTHNENVTRCPSCGTELFTIEDDEDDDVESDRSDNKESSDEEDSDGENWSV